MDWWRRLNFTTSFINLTSKGFFLGGFVKKELSTNEWEQAKEQYNVVGSHKLTSVQSKLAATLRCRYNH